MSIAAGKRVLVALAVVALAAMASASPVVAECCVCTGCEGREAVPLCLPLDGCDFGECELRCTSAGCENATFHEAQCNVVPECAVPAPAGGAALLLCAIVLFMTISAVALRRRSLPAAVRVAGLVGLILASAAAIEAITQIQLTGQWQSAAGPGAAVRPEQWKAQLVVGKDGTLSGTVKLTGFGDVTAASVEGTLIDGVTSGTLRAADGTVVAEFEGSGNALAVHGTFTKTQTGETGTFSWTSGS